MKNEKVPFIQKVSKFLEGRGFYIVLLACIAVIGVSAWSLVLTSSGGSGYYVDYSDTLVADPTPDAAVFAPERGPVLVPATPKPPVVPQTTPLVPSEDTAAEVPATAEPTEPPEEEQHKAKTISDLTFARPVAGDLSQKHSIDALVYSRTLGDWRTHAGVDISAALGAKVQAATDGTVTEIREDNMLGTTVVIDHGFGLCSIYANLAAQPAVAVGDNVALGAVIGSIGNTALGESGEVTHLHFEMTLDGQSVDPMDYLP